MTQLSSVAPAFVEMAHRIVWCIAGTVTPQGTPRTRVLHPIWEWDGEALTGWIATSPRSPKALDLAATPELSLTYWAPNQDTCTADCATSWDDTPEARAEGWRRFADGPAPVGYDPSLIPQWTSPDAPDFGVLRLEPHRLRVMPGALMTRGEGELLTWRA
jgi:hypothetical protein